ncbi:MAG TPA: M20/M25/M40 family metallo-hydrolase, partial [Longimicrobium sp.]|nr:M20/M25/M40 family metallo-hydrolase [Longimicrobium sp.]
MSRALLALALLAACAPAAAQECPAPPAGEAQPAAAVRWLSQDALEGRLAGSPGERCAGDYLAAEFARIGLKPTGEGGTFFQDVSLASAMNPHAQAGTGRNVVGLLEGADPALRGEAVVVGAHYDHLGRGERFSLGAQGQVHNGADDNASGVAALLSIAEALARGPRPARTVVFIAFTGEEGGLLGSARYAAAPAVPLDRTRAMLNLDMVGRLEGKPLLVYGTGTAAEMEALVRAAGAAEGMELALHPDGYGPSDHTSFYARDVPVLHLFTNVHGDYHRPSDDAEKVDVPGVRRVASLAARIVADVAARPAALTHVAGAGTPPRPPSSSGSGSGSGYGSYLGTVPDFTPVEHGVKLSGVRAGSPAERAGIRGGDVIVAMDDAEIADL